MRRRDVNPLLRLQLGQQELTAEQAAEAHQFAQDRCAAQLATEPVDEHEAEEWMRQAYTAANLTPPQRVIWLDGPLQLVALLNPSVRAHVGNTVWGGATASAGDSDRAISASAWNNVRETVRESVGTSVGARVGARVRESVGVHVRASGVTGIGVHVRASVGDHVRENISASTGVSIEAFARASIEGVRASDWAGVWRSFGDSFRDSARAYLEASPLAFYHFFDVYLAPNALHAWAHFNEMVSGYWLGKDIAAVMRRPRLLARDAEGRLHGATGKCIEYRDGWGFYAWHGLRMPEKVIVAPDRLTRDDFLGERNVEVRRIIQERMGDRFIPELGGTVLHESTRGKLYEVDLPADDPERVARYVQVQDASTPRQYFLRVPPTVATADEAMAWTWGMSTEQYRPSRET